MKRLLCAGALLLLIASPALLRNKAVAQTPAAAATDQHREMLDTYCFTCHNTAVKAGGLALDALNLQNAPDDAKTWEKALRKLRGRLMPPPGNPQPDQKDIDSFVTWMENDLDTHAKGPKAGYVPVQRLNRTEYAASVRTLLGVDVNEKEILPQDIQVEGFDNIASALTTSPAFLDQYLDAARRVAKKAVGDMAPPISDWPIKAEGNQDPELPFPPGFRQRDAMKITHNFPADGEYRFNTAFDERSIGLYNAGLQNRTTLVLLLDGKVVFKGDIGGSEDLRLANVKGTDGWASRSWIASRRSQSSWRPARTRLVSASSTVRLWNRTTTWGVVAGDSVAEPARRWRAWRIQRMFLWRSRGPTIPPASHTAPAGH